MADFNPTVVAYIVDMVQMHTTVGQRHGGHFGGHKAYPLWVDKDPCPPKLGMPDSNV